MLPATCKTGAVPSAQRNDHTVVLDVAARSSRDKERGGVRSPKSVSSFHAKRVPISRGSAGELMLNEGTAATKWYHIRSKTGCAALEATFFAVIT